MRNRSDLQRTPRDSGGVSIGYWVLLLACAILAWNLSPSALAQSAPVRATANSRHKKPAPPPPLITETSPVPAPPPTPPPVLTPEQMPPRPPEVTWDGKLLSITAENSTLSDILVAVRARTGADIDIPAATAGDRMAARLGPAPVREVLTSLLSGTNYNYIIQASETDEDGIQSVILTPRGKGEELTASATASTPGVRRPPGYTASGKHTFEVIPDQAKASPAAQDVASTGDEGQTGEPAEASGAEPTSASAQPSAADPPPQANSSSNPAPSLASSDSPTVGRGLLPGIDPSGDPPTIGQMVQGMQQLYEQRRQIQVQQNQAQQNRAAPPTN